MTDQDDGGGAPTDEVSEAWDQVADRAHDEGQAVLDGLERRARKLERRVRRPRNAPERILKLMD